MKKILFAVLLLCGMAGAQVVVGNYGIKYVASAPSGACSQNEAMQELVGTGVLYTCQSGTWTALPTSAGGSGSVTNIATTSPITGGPITTTGTIACATCGVTGTNLSQFAAGGTIAPAVDNASTSMSAPFWVSTNADPADAGAIRLGNAELIEWENNPTGTDATFGLTSGNILTSSVNVSAPGLVSTVSTGTAPLTVTSTTNVANLNASSLSGATFAAPGTIGGTTPGIATFTTANTTLVAMANGATASPAITSNGAGIYGSAAGTWVWQSAASTDKIAFAAASMNMVSGSCYGWTNSATVPNAAADTAICRGAGGVAQMNGAAAASPAAATIRGQGGSGTNIVGATLTLGAGIGTGNATPAQLVFQGDPFVAGSGASAHTPVKRHVTGVIKALTTATPTTIASIPLATLQNTGGHIWYHMEASDGTSQCSSDGDITYSAENSASVFVTNVSSIGDLATACTATKTLTGVWALSSANPAILSVTPTLTGITATSFNIIYEASNFGQTDPTY